MKKDNFVAQKHKDKLKQIFAEASQFLVDKNLDKTERNKKLQSILRKHPKSKGKLFAKDQLLKGYSYLLDENQIKPNPKLKAMIKMKPIRSSSGVLPLTVLTKPYPCPGKCIFCPSDVRMPKSYLPSEPGAQRAERNYFDPYLQTYNRLLAFKNTGHDVAKIELIILGGTWSYYPQEYQVWFVKRCFEAMNDFSVKGAKENLELADLEKGKDMENLEQKATWEELYNQQRQNETAQARCVGLVIETRPDYIDEAEVRRVRKLGATKTQIGFQSLDDEVLAKNKRGHDTAATKRAVALVRSAGFKIHAHWMANLYGSSPEKDKQDFDKLWQAEYQPDELKIYPCSLIESAELMSYYKKGLWRPYTEEELLDVVVYALTHTPRYVRLSRVIRDIPSQDIVVGNKKTNFRQIVENHIKKSGLTTQDIRSREIRDRRVDLSDVKLKVTDYEAKTVFGPTKEKFLEFVTSDDKICAFLRLSLPDLDGGDENVETNNGAGEVMGEDKRIGGSIGEGEMLGGSDREDKTASETEHFIKELSGSAIIREVHVYGVAQKIGAEGRRDSAQHLGFGSRLIEKAKSIASQAGYKNLAVISAIGTREYYRKKGFEDRGLYQHCVL